MRDYRHITTGGRSGGSRRGTTKGSIQSLRTCPFVAESGRLYSQAAYRGMSFVAMCWTRP